MLTVRLLGPPAIERDGHPLRSPRGRKAWALLSYVLLAERPPSRRDLAEMLFGDADDPLGALRWTLAELRRALGDSLALRGDPLVATLEPDAVVDIYLVTREYADTSPLLDIAGEQLPVIWDCDFLLGPKNAAGEDSYVLCEINVSSVMPIPDQAPAEIARLAKERLLLSRRDAQPRGA